MKKATEYFKVVSVKGNVMTVEFYLEKPSIENRSVGTVIPASGDEKEQRIRDGKNYVIGKAFGKLPFTIGGKPVKINCSVMLPVSDATTAKEDIEL